jgi:hypothetical protein
MRIYRLLESDVKRSDFISNAVTLIKQDCQPFLTNNLSAMKSGGRLMRGISKIDPLTDAFITQKVWVNKTRRPTDTPLQFHFLIDMFMEETLGYAYRSSSCFASTSKAMAGSYGMAYTIFPIGDYDICYSPTVNDLFEWFQRVSDGIIDPTVFGNDSRFLKETAKYGLTFESVNDIATAFKLFRFGEIYDTTGKDKFAEFNNYLFNVVFPRLGYTQTKQIKETHGHECMIRCDQYYGILNQGNYEIGHHPVDEIIAAL